MSIKYSNNLQGELSYDVSKGSIHDLVKEAQNGSDDAFEKLLHKLNPIISSCIRKYTHRTRDAPDDLRQLASIAVWNAVNTFQEGNPSFNLYAKTFIIRSLMTHVRDENKSLNMSINSIPWEDNNLDDYLPSEDRSISEMVEDRQMFSSVVKEIRDYLSHGERELAALHFVHNMSVREISDYYGISYSAAYQRVRRMTEKMRNIYYKEDD